MVFVYPWKSSPPVGVGVGPAGVVVAVTGGTYGSPVLSSMPSPSASTGSGTYGSPVLSSIPSPSASTGSS